MTPTPSTHHTLIQTEGQHRSRLSSERRRPLVPGAQLAHQSGIWRALPANQKAVLIPPPASFPEWPCACPCPSSGRRPDSADQRRTTRSRVFSPSRGPLARQGIARLAVLPDRLFPG